MTEVRLAYQGLGGWRGWMAAPLLPHADRAGLSDLDSLVARATGRAAGRGEALFLPVGPHRAVLRRYRHGGLLRAFTGELFRELRSQDEAQLLDRLRARGAPCPEPLGAFWRPRGAGLHQLALLTREVPGARAAPEVFRALPRGAVRTRRRALRALARAVRAFHDAGGDHADLNARNLVLDDAGKGWVLDLDLGSQFPAPAPAPVRARNLARLARSWRKLDPEGRWVNARDALAFARAYGGGRLRGFPPGGGAGLPRSGEDLGGALWQAFGMLLLPLLPLAWLWFARVRKRVVDSWPQRLLWRLPEAPPGGRPIVVHAASVGEVTSAAPLLRQLRRHFPGVPLVVSTLSEEGQARARRLCQSEAAPPLADGTVYLPADLPGLPGRWLDALAPRLLVVLETELWPGLYRAARDRGLPLATANMRVAPNRVVRYRRLGPVYLPLFQIPDYMAAQNHLECARILALGAPSGRVRVPGDLKFDQVLENLVDPRRAALAPALLGRGPRLVAGSVHPGEDAIVLDAYLVVRRHHPEARLTIAPRHLGDVDRVADLLRERQLPFARRSHSPGAVTTPVLLLDTHGELAFAYEGAAAAFVGGSLVPVGGHSPLEPAVFRVPVLVGPEAYNFEAMNARLEDGGGLARVQDGAALAECWSLLLDAPDEAAARGQDAYDTLAALGGAGATVARHLRERWPDL